MGGGYKVMIKSSELSPDPKIKIPKIPKETGKYLDGKM